MNKKISVNLYIALFFSGLVIAAIASARYIETADPLELMSSSAFIVGMTLSVLSLVLWRKEISSCQGEKSAISGENSTSPIAIVNALKTALESLEKKASGLSREDWMKELKNIEAQFIFPFHEVKGALSFEMDMHEKADYLLGFAYGERMINRAYSYCADGFCEDAVTLIQAAKESFEKQCLSKN